MSKFVGKAVLYYGTEDELWGICESSDLSFEADKEQIKDGQGNTVGLHYTDLRRKVALSFTPLEAAKEADLPCDDDLIGEEITVKAPGGDVKIIIDNASRGRKKGGSPTFSFDGYHYPAISGATTTP